MQCYVWRCAMQHRKALNNIIMKIVYKLLIMCFAMALFTACGGSSNGGGHDHEHEGGEHAHGGNEISFSPEKV